MNPHANRPTSPHLQAYKLPLTGIISISHRMTGVALSLGLCVMVYMIVSVAGGDSVYIQMQKFMSYWFMKLLYFAFIFALFFHLCHGIRHLVWDAGHSFERENLKTYAFIELGFALALTLAALV